MFVHRDGHQIEATHTVTVMFEDAGHLKKEEMRDRGFLGGRPSGQMSNTTPKPIRSVGLCQRDIVVVPSEGTNECHHLNRESPSDGKLNERKSRSYFGGDKGAFEGVDICPGLPEPVNSGVGKYIKIDRIRSLAPPPPPTQGPFSAPAIRPQINLPALQLTDFDGFEGNWPSFWAAFGHTIHDNSSLTGAQKLTYLVGRLRGSARTLVDGFSLTDHNYPIVVDLLKGRYGDDDKRGFFENVDRVCRQLESLGDDTTPHGTMDLAKLDSNIKSHNCTTYRTADERRARLIFPGLFRIDTVSSPIFEGEMDLFCPPSLSVPIPLSSMACGAIVRPENPMIWSNVSGAWRQSGLMTHWTQMMMNWQFRFSRILSNLRGTDMRSGGHGCRGKGPVVQQFFLGFSSLMSLSQKLRANSEFRERYQATISEQLKMGIIEPAARTGAREHFIPHHAVVTPKKLRVVYDASVHEASLNELLLPGPNLVPELAGVLLRFRAATCPVLRYIEKAFLAVGLKDEDREVAKFLWMKDPSKLLTPENLIIYRFKRIAFGVNSSPFLLASVLLHHFASSGDPMGMARNFYVDNLLICSETASEAAAAVRSARREMAKAGMRLHEFVAADPRILFDIPPEEVLVGDVQRVLGICWVLPRDEINFEFPKANDFPKN
ncbi:hypothetical protein niasHS_012862 [Heterodera schachtii]|uniref:Reverse transcriptase domain-containing protein n=1 Tax=Heterodera schachtii TaxID=97005 RepID=A0ABD2IFD3_HETSC